MLPAVLVLVASRWASHVARAAYGVPAGVAQVRRVPPLAASLAGVRCVRTLSDAGHDVTIVDNLSRRDIDTELGCDSRGPVLRSTTRRPLPRRFHRSRRS